MPTVITRDQYLEINTVPLATPAWRILDLSRLYGLVVRGSDRVIPGTAGVFPHARRVTLRTIGLPILVEGARDHEGVAHSNAYDGLDINIDYLIANVVEPVAPEGSPAVWHRASGNVEADVHVEAFEPQAWGRGWVRFMLDLTVPAGRFS